MSAIDTEYYRRREQQERARAEMSEDTPARRVHLEMAERYSAMLRERSPAPIVTLVPQA